MHTASVRKINRKNASSPTYIEVGPSAPPTIEIAGVLSNKLKTVVACSGMRPMFNISAIINSVFRTLLFILCNLRSSTSPTLQPPSPTRCASIAHRPCQARQQSFLQAAARQRPPRQPRSHSSGSPCWSQTLFARGASRPYQCRKRKA